MTSLYIHIPFCVAKCLYCGFYSTGYSLEAGRDYVAALESEADIYRPLLGVRTISTVYLGGGTPTVLSLQQLKRVLNIIADFFSVSLCAEFTVEANPNSLTADHIALFKERGVNRLSLGIQSFSDEMLAFLGRPHTSADGKRAFLLARKAGIGNIGLDLMYGIPGQTGSSWSSTLLEAIQLGPEHISIYSLSLDSGSRFSRWSEAGELALPQDDHVAGQYESALELLSRAGYEQYEISNFSLRGFSCRHNQNYWQRGEYLGMGPGASSFINNRRYNNIPDLAGYCGRLRSKNDASIIEGEETLGPEESADETIMLACRTADGLDLERFRQQYGAERSHRVARASEPLTRSGLATLSERRLRLTKKGFLLADEVLKRLIL